MILLTDTNLARKQPSPNEVVFYHPPHKLAYPVVINSGSYLGHNGGLSNFWTWSPVKQSGKISKKEQRGYGIFTIASGWLDVKVKRTIMFETIRK